MGRTPHGARAPALPPSRRPLRGLARPHRRACPRRRGIPCAVPLTASPSASYGRRSSRSTSTTSAPRRRPGAKTAMGDVAHGAPPPPLPQDGALAPRRAAPRRDPPRPAPAREERSCQEVPPPQENAPPLLAPPRQDRLPRPGPAQLAEAARGHQDQALPPRQAPATTADCHGFTPELRSVAWPGKFKPDLPPRYDGTPDPAEFL